MGFSCRRSGYCPEVRNFERMAERFSAVLETPVLLNENGNVTDPSVKVVTYRYQEVCTVPLDIMKLATDRVRELFEAGKIQDLVTREKLAAKWDERPDSWVSAFDSYMILCPGDIYDKAHPELHRALDDAMREAEILYSCLEAAKED